MVTVVSTLHEVLAVLLGAESEARRMVEDAKKDSSQVMKTTQEIFRPDRESKMGAAREQAKSVIANAVAASQAEAEQISSLGREERESMKARFDENVDTVVSTVVAETVERIMSGRL